MPQQTPANAVGNFQYALQVANIPCSLTAAASTTVFTVPSSRRFILTRVVVHDPTGNAGSATVNVGAVVGGTPSAAAYNSAQALTALGTSAGSTFTTFSPSATGAPVLGGGDTITVAPGTAATGVTVSVDVIGYLL